MVKIEAWMQPHIEPLYEVLHRARQAPETTRQRVCKAALADLFMGVWQPSEDEWKRFQSACDKVAKMRQKVSEAAVEGDPSMEKISSEFQQISTVITHLVDKQRNEQNQQRKLYRQKTSVKIAIDPTAYIGKANQILQQTLINARPKWEDVSCSIALCTGRRMSEIHCSGEFELLGEYELGFIGQLKTKGHHREVLPIPTLVRAELILSGISYLEKYNRRKETPDEVNSLIAPYLTKVIRKDWMVVDDKSWKKADDKTTMSKSKEKMTYHKFRAIWLTCVLPEYLKDNDYSDREAMRLGADLLGDNSSETAESYNRFTLAEGAIVRA